MLIAVPERGRRLPDGVLIKGSILARVLGLRVLTLDATVVLTPADVSDPKFGSDDPKFGSDHPKFGSDHSLRRTPSAAGQPNRLRAPSHGLADAIRRLDEGAALLAESREDAG